MLRSIGSVTFLALLMVGCGGGNSGSSPPPPATYSIGGTVTGLTGSGLVLQTNAGDLVPVSKAAAFTFTNQLGSGAAYVVTVKTQPSAPAQNCVVTNGSGTVGTTNITTVAVACTVANYTVSGTVSGLAGTGLVLRDNGGDDLGVAANGVIEFPTKIASGATYSVTVFTQPTSPVQTCVITHGSGTMGSSDVTNVAVSCTLENGFTGFVSGLYLYTGISSSGATRSGPDVFDGVGGYSGSYVSNSSGVISSGSISGSYTSAVGGAMTLGAYSGEVSADGNTILFANLQAGDAPYVEVDIKQGQTNFTNADFSGIYQVVSVSSSADSSSTLTLTADGAGSCSGTLVQNNAGVITSSAVSATYSVAADGGLTITPASGSPLSGGISADGRTLVLSQLTAGQPSEVAVGIKQGQTNFTNADVVGTYSIVNYSNSAELVTLDFDGAGNVNGTVTSNVAGTIANDTVTGTCAVVADGTLTVTILHPYSHRPPSTFTGGVSSDGNTLVLTYLHAGQPSATSVGVRL